MVAAALPTAAGLYGQVEQQIQGYGASEQAALKQSYQNALGQGMQSLASSGLAGTSIAPSMRMGYMKQYQLAMNNLNQQLQQTQLGAEQTFGLGGIQSEQAQQGLALSAKQISNQMTLGMGQLNQGQGYLSLAQQQQQNQMNMQQQQLGYQYAALNQQNAQNSPLPGTSNSPYSLGAQAGFAGFGP